MKATEALIAWTSAYSKNSTKGKIEVRPLILGTRQDWTEPFLYKGGAKYSDWRKLKGWEAVAKTFIEFNAIVVRDGLSPEVVHEAFLAIDEYAEHFLA